MGNFGTGEMVFSILLFMIGYTIFSGIRNRGVVHLALNNFVIDPEANDLIIIEGRKTGLWQWILVRLKLGNIYKIKVHKEYVSYSENSARGEILTLVPIKRISSTTCGYQKPLGLLILAVVFILLGIVSILAASATRGASMVSAVVFIALGVALV
ncbi:MAG: hypothetical protein LIP01_12740, partial [Tannerellaceae bacterium]|nr:hypothetical protein [Tannerellaceae bacterium]